MLLYWTNRNATEIGITTKMASNREDFQTRILNTAPGIQEGRVHANRSSKARPYGGIAKRVQENITPMAVTDNVVVEFRILRKSFFEKGCQIEARVTCTRKATSDRRVLPRRNWRIRCLAERWCGCRNRKLRDRLNVV